MAPSEGGDPESRLPDNSRGRPYRLIGQRIRWARELIYPDKISFAAAMGISPGMLTRVEDGERCLSIFNLIAAGIKLRTGVEFLLTGELRLVQSKLLRGLLRRHPELLEGQLVDLPPLKEHDPPLAPLSELRVDMDPDTGRVVSPREMLDRAADTRDHTLD